MGNIDNLEQSFVPVPKLVLEGREVNGPFDESEVVEVKDYIKFGSIWILPFEGMNLNLEVEDKTKRILSMTISYKDSTLQLQAFAASRSEGLWQTIQENIQESVKNQQGTVESLQGTFGLELLATIPVVTSEHGSKSFKAARFVGVDGPRWFLRGVFGGSAALHGEDAEVLENFFKKVVVSRGERPMPPRELISLQLPENFVGDFSNEHSGSD